MSVLAQIAEGYAAADPGRAVDILEPLIATLNQKMPALAVVDGFVGWSHSFVGNEMMMQFGPGAEMARGITNAIATLAVQQPERAAGLASSLQRPELRTIAYMEMARRLLAQDVHPQRVRGSVVVRGGAFQF